jgi:hypothetical protein
LQHPLEQYIQILFKLTWKLALLIANDKLRLVP